MPIGQKKQKIQNPGRRCLWRQADYKISELTNTSHITNIMPLNVISHAQVDRRNKKQSNLVGCAVSGISDYNNYDVRHTSHISIMGPVIVISDA